MKKNLSASWLRIAGTLSLSTLSLLAANVAQATLLIEPMLDAGYGNSSSPLLTSTGVSTLGAGLRLGSIEEDYFGAFEVHYDLGSVGGGSSASNAFFGLVGGVNLATLPLRFSLNFNFADSYSDSFLHMSGISWGFGIGYFINPKIIVNFLYTNHEWDGLANKFSTAPLAFDKVSFGAATIALSMPLDFEMPKEPWRRKYDTRSRHASPAPEGLNEPTSDGIHAPPPAEPTAPPALPQAAPEIPAARPETPQAAPELPAAAPELPPATPELPAAAPELPAAAPELPPATPELPTTPTDVPQAAPDSTPPPAEDLAPPPSP